MFSSGNALNCSRVSRRSCRIILQCASIRTIMTTLLLRLSTAISRKLTQKHQQMTLRLEIVRLLAGHG